LSFIWLGFLILEMNKSTADTPLDVCPHCGSPKTEPLSAYHTCKADTTQRDEDGRTHLCREREARQKAEAEVEHIKSLLKDPRSVHLNTIRGNIATLAWDTYEHIIGHHPCRERAEKAEAEVARLTKLTEDCLNVIRVYCPTFYNDAMERFNSATEESSAPQL